MARALFCAVSLCVLPACAVPRTVALLQERSPPPEFGRPGWVRACAGTGAWIGGVIGAIGSVVLLPVTYPIVWISGDALGGTARDEFLYFPATGLAATGHFLFGGPPDLLDHVFRRAWLDETPPANTYELIPMEPPAPPSAPAGNPPAEAPATTATAK